MTLQKTDIGELFCLPKDDPEKRFVIGILGRKNLLCIGLNPNTADATRLDGTSRNFQRIAKDNGYDGWLLVNLYPARDPKAVNLVERADGSLFRENMDRIEEVASSEVYGVRDVLLGWGNDVVRRSYFENGIRQIHQRLNKFNLRYHAFRVNRTGHPGHPSPLTINSRYKTGESIRMSPFDFDQYVKDLVHFGNARDQR